MKKVTKFVSLLLLAIPAFAQTFNPNGDYSNVSNGCNTYFFQKPNYFDNNLKFIGTTLPPCNIQSMGTQLSNNVYITGGSIDGVTIGSNSIINAPISGSVTNATITNPTITGGTINNTSIGQTTPASGAFTALNATNASVLGPVAGEGVNSTGNGQAASPTNTGTQMSSTFAMETFYDSARTADNRSADLVWLSGSFSARFKNDAGNTATPWLSAAGGQASGITGITSSSGSGTWAHTGAFSASGAVNSSTGLTVKEGSNAKQGVATLVAGTITVANTSVTATSRILLTVQSLGTVTAPKAIAVTARTASTSFVITSADNTDTSVVAYEIFEVGS